MWYTHSQELSALIDSQADLSSLDRAVAQQLGVQLVPRDISMRVSALNGMHLARVEHNTAPLALLLSGNHRESIAFYIICSPQTPLVLGHPWLRLQNPRIEWATGTSLP